MLDVFYLWKSHPTWVPSGVQRQTAVTLQFQTAVTAWFSSNQLLLFVFAMQLIWKNLPTWVPSGVHLSNDLAAVKLTFTLVGRDLDVVITWCVCLCPGCRLVSVHHVHGCWNNKLMSWGIPEPPDWSTCPVPHTTGAALIWCAGGVARTLYRGCSQLEL